MAMSYARAMRLARAVLAEHELRGDHLTVAEKVAQAAVSPGTRGAITKALRGHVRHPAAVAGQIYRGDVPSEEPELDLSSLGQLAPDVERAVSGAIRQATRGSVRSDGDRYAMLAKRLEPHLANITDTQLVEILAATFHAESGVKAGSRTIVRIVRNLARDIGKRALPYAQAAQHRCPELQAIVARLTGADSSG